MKPFTHRFAEQAWIDFEKDQTGGYKPVGFTIVANIPLAQASSGYQPGQVKDLETAAVAYAKKLGVPITFRGRS